MAHLMASRYIFWMSGSSHVSAKWPKFDQNVRPFAVRARERDRKIGVLAVVVGVLQIEVRSIEVREHPHLVARVRLLAQHVKLFAPGEGRRQMAHRRKIGRVDDDASLENAPGMIVEVAAHHLAELCPLVERRVPGVRADNAFTVRP